MPTQAPGDLIASRIAVMADGAVAEVVLTERPAPYASTLREAYARWHSGGAWSAWRLVADSAFDVSIAPDLGQQEPAALISVLVWVPAPAGGIAVQHVPHQSMFFRLSASGVSSASAPGAQQGKDRDERYQRRPRKRHRHPSGRLGQGERLEGADLSAPNLALGKPRRHPGGGRSPHPVCPRSTRPAAGRRRYRVTGIPARSAAGTPGAAPAGQNRGG
jgi:hypothetical protein